MPKEGLLKYWELMLNDISVFNTTDTTNLALSMEYTELFSVKNLVL